MNPLRIVTADDNALIRSGVRAMVDAIEDMEVIEECVDAVTLREAVERCRPDVVLTDIQMPPTHTDEGIVAAVEFRASYPDMGVLVLSHYAEPELVTSLFERGSSGLGYLLKEGIGDLDALERAIRAVAAGESAIDPRVVEVLVTAGARRESELSRLTPRETEVLSLIAEGLNNAAIQERLVLGEKAVAKHINGIFTKLDLGEDAAAHRRVKAVLMWLAG